MHNSAEGRQCGRTAINCVFDPSCTVTVTDTTAPIPIPAGGTNFLQSRTFMGKPGAPANGLYAYEYRIDLRNAVGITYIPCLSSMTIEFGPVVSALDYNGDGEADQVCVITSGGLGSIGPLQQKKKAIRSRLHLALPCVPVAILAAARVLTSSDWFRHSRP
jgi:hypothetical protein